MKKSEFYSDYKKARDKAWDIIIKYNVSSLPVGMLDLCRRMGIRAVSYDKAPETIHTHDLIEYTVDNDGFAALINGHYIIFYDDFVTPRTRLRFTLGHEIGHVVLGHLLDKNESCQNRVTVWNRGELKEPNKFETAANIFGSRLLAPACVLRKLNIHTPEEIEKLCGLSKAAAKVRAERMALLYSREREWLERYGKTCFGLSPHEQAALKQFDDFIKMYEKNKNAISNIKNLRLLNGEGQD